MKEAGLNPTSGLRQREIFLGALERTDLEARAVYLAEQCEGDRGLHGNIEELLKEQQQLDGFLQTPLVRDGQLGFSNKSGPKSEAAMAESPGDLVGPFRLVEKLGEGGCGVVYLAEQQEPFRRPIALKIIKLGMDTRQVIARFEAERQALALMEHPNIARVFAAGCTQTGRPYFAMELARGLRITEYCDQHHLRIRERINLFVQVCSAIQHAHQKGVIHRDIKPSNILVVSQDGRPVPKIIDFGIAKATAQLRLTDRTLLTGYEQFLGTPAYMSPEQTQMGGVDVDTRSDIYSLGVLLYELLTGKTPFDRDLLQHLGLDECRRTIREAEPPRPSASVSGFRLAELQATATHRRLNGPKLIDTLKGDPDSIVMKALEKDRVRRYPTANDFALDLERYLANEPVSASPPSNWYRLQKLLRRHQQAVAASLLILILLVGGAATSVYLGLRAVYAERQAEVAQRLEANLRREAEVEGLRAREQAAAARKNEDVADINLAHHSVRDGNFGRAIQLLRKHKVGLGEASPNTFEWRYLWQLTKGDEHLALPAQTSAIRSISISDDGRLAAIECAAGLQVLHLATDSVLLSISNSVSSAAFLPGTSALLTSGPNGVQLWDTKKWEVAFALGSSGGPAWLSADGRNLALSTPEGLQVLRTHASRPPAGETTPTGPASLEPSWIVSSVLAEASGPAFFSHDGNRLVAVSPQGLVVWTLSGNGAELTLANSRELFGGAAVNLGSGRVLAFSPDDRSIVAVSNTAAEGDRYVVRVWDADTGLEKASLPESSDADAHTGMLASLDFSPDGRLVATASLDHSVCLWDFASRKLVARLRGHLNEVLAVTFAPDSRGLLTGAKDGGLKWWAAQRPTRHDLLSAAMEPLRFSRDGRYLGALSPDRNAVLFINIITGQVEWRAPLAQNPLESRFAVALSEDFRFLIEGGTNGLARIRDLQTGELRSVEVGRQPIGFVMLTPDNQHLVTASAEEGLYWHDLRARTHELLDADATQATFSADFNRLALFGSRGGVLLWDAASRQQVNRINLESTPASHGRFSPDGRTLAVIDPPAWFENAVRLYDVVSGKLLGKCIGHKQALRDAVFSPDARTLVTSSDDNSLKFWNLATLQELMTVHLEDGPAGTLCFSPDGLLLAVGAEPGSRRPGIRLFRAPMPDENDLMLQSSTASAAR